MAAYLLFKLHGNGVGFLKEDGVTPQVIPQGRELVMLPLSPCMSCQFELLLGPVALCVKQRVHCKSAGLNVKANQSRHALDFI